MKTLGVRELSRAGVKGVCAVVPCFNEGARLAPVVDSLMDLCGIVIVVDDGSAKPPGIPPRPGLRLLRHPVNRGQGAALATGFACALGYPWDALVTFDGDGQHDAGDIPHLVEPVLEDRCDVALGSRFLGDAEGMPPSRRALLGAARWIEWARTGILLTDAHNGLRAMNRKAAEKMDLRLDRFAHASEILQIVRNERLRWCEVPVSVRYSDDTLTKGQGLADGVRILFDLAARALFSEEGR